MIEITFKDFHEYKYAREEGHELYVMKNGLGETLYVGISSQNIWNRWFGWNGHIMEGPNYLVGQSSIGQKIVDHLPDSWEWKIQLWALEDCMKFCADELNPNGRYNIKWLEPIMIQKLRPSLNSIYNLNPVWTTPLSVKGKNAAKQNWTKHSARYLKRKAMDENSILLLLPSPTTYSTTT